jgi:hypothetical protein
MDYQTYRQHCLIVEAYGTLVQDRIEQGWIAYLLTFMFKPMPGNPTGVLERMQRGVESFYATLVTRVVRHNRSKALQHSLPVLIGAPDVPVFKHAKQSISNICINDGLHYHAIVLIPEKCRLRTDLVEHVREKYHAYVRQDGPLMLVDVAPITETPSKVTCYGLKAVRNGRISDDKILILPKSLSELGKKEQRV